MFSSNNQTKTIMTKDEKLIISKFGRVNPFAAPEGYFSSFARDFAERLPERETAAAAVPADNSGVTGSLRVSVWHKVACAACVAVAALLTSLYLVGSDSDDNSQQATTDMMSYDDYVDMVADYAMMDNDDIYALISEE